MYLKRYADKLVQGIFADGKVGIILGARQVGKTTLVEHVFAGQKVCFLNFDVESDKARFKSAAALPPPEGLRALGSPDMLVIDEAQRMPEVSRVIKGWYDRHLPVKMLLLGSSSLDLLSQSAESLTGRNRKLTLTPLLFAEALGSTSWFNPALPKEHLQTYFASQLRAFLMQRLSYGSYPEVVVHQDPEPLLRELSSDYLWKDVLQSGLVKHPDMIRRLLLLLAHQAGSEVSVSELATQLQMTRPTIDRYLDLLVQTFVIFRLPSYSTNPRKEISKSQKIFFWDTGIRNALLSQFSQDDLRPDIGKLWENWVIAEVAKNNVLRGSQAELYFWRTRAQSEVDLVVKRGGKLRAYEIKWSSRRTGGRAFADAYQIAVETVTPDHVLMLEDI
jgi:predicted AAA+ superfamily ATPase